MEPITAIAVLAAAAVVALAAAGHAAPTPEQSCAAAKLTAESKLAQCRLKADATWAKNGDVAKRTAAYAKCGQKLVTAYTVAETKYAGACPTTLDATPIQSFLGECTELARDWTAGDLPTPPVFERFAASGQTACWVRGSAFSSPVETDCAATGQDGDHTAGAALAYVDNGNGTITDVRSGLVWERKSDDNSAHDKDRVFRWAGVCTFDGSTFCTRNGDCDAVGGSCMIQGGGSTIFQWIDQLNASSFAGHSDWRLPNVRELASLVSYGEQQPAVDAAFDTGCGPGQSGCSVTSCSCTQPQAYWTSSTNAQDPRQAWSVDFFDGGVDGSLKNVALHVRAVRGGR
jgi:hypothetical protein